MDKYVTTDQLDRLYQEGVEKNFQKKTVNIALDELNDWIAGNGVSSDHNLYDITYGDGKFVAVAGYGGSYYSADGINWTAGSDPDDYLKAVAYGDGKFVAVNEYGTPYCSTDGINWTKGDEMGGSTYDVAYGMGKFVAVGDSGNVCYSTDGVNWSNGSCATSTVNLTNYDLRSVAYSDDWNRFVAVAGGESNYKGIFYSSDGINWTKASSTIEYYMNAVAFGNPAGGSPQYLAVGEDGHTYYGNGQSWTEGSSGCSYDLYGIAYGNGKFVAVGGSGETYYTTNITDWSYINGAGSASFNAVAYGDGKFVAVGDDGAVYCSIDGKTETHNLEEVINRLYSAVLA